MDSKECSLFNFNKKGVRIVGTSDQPWFVLKDVAEILGINNHFNVAASLDTDEKALHSMEGSQKMTIINESGLYQMIFQSRKPEAKAFKKWVCSDLLPTLRKQGHYKIENEKKELQEKLIRLEQQYSNRQYITDDPTFITITDRLDELGLFKKSDLKKVMRTMYIECKNRFCRIEHPDKGKLKGHLLRMSKLMSRHKKLTMKEYPNIRRIDRRNAYYTSDYEKFGDDILRNYFREHPVDTWEIDFTW